MINEFVKIAPYIVEAVRVKLTSGVTEEETMAIIHQEIVNFFRKQELMFLEFLSFDATQRATFCAAMYSAIKPIADKTEKNLNPKYSEYVLRTGLTGAKNFITNKH